jgi:transposase
MPSASVSPRVLEASYLSLKPGDDPNGWSPKVSFVTRVGDLGCGVHRFRRDSSTQPGSRIMRYELTDFEWAAIRSFLPNKPRGIPRVDDRRVLNGIFWVLRSGAPWRDLPEAYGPRTTCYNRFVRWRQAGVWDRIMDAFPREPGTTRSRC